MPATLLSTTTQSSTSALTATSTAHLVQELLCLPMPTAVSAKTLVVCWLMEAAIRPVMEDRSASLVTAAVPAVQAHRLTSAWPAKGARCFIKAAASLAALQAPSLKEDAAVHAQTAALYA
jgi:hypothetical protein